MCGEWGKARVETALRLFGVAFLEAFDATSGVHVFLRAGKERVARIADIHVQAFARGPRLDHVAAGAGDRRLNIFGVNTVLHGARNLREGSPVCKLKCAISLANPSSRSGFASCG